MLGRIANRYIKSIPKIIGMLALIGILSILSLYVVPFVNTLANDDSVTYGAGGVAGTRVYCEQDTNDFLTCPVANASAPMVDSVRGVLDNFLKIEPKLYSLDGAVYKLWSNIKDIANIFIVICFILIVISQLTGGLLSNYTIKKALPRLIVMAILVNVSYFICLIIIDVAQIAGAGVSGLFAPLRELSSVTGYTTAEKGFIQGAGATSIATGLLIYLFANKNRKNRNENKPKKENMIQAGNENIREIYLAGGCFWGLEAYMERIDGVVSLWPCLLQFRHLLSYLEFLTTTKKAFSECG